MAPRQQYDVNLLYIDNKIMLFINQIMNYGLSFVIQFLYSS